MLASNAYKSWNRFLHENPTNTHNIYVGIYIYTRIHGRAINLTFSQLKKLLNSSVPPKNVGLLLHLEIEMYENARLGS